MVEDAREQAQSLKGPHTETQRFESTVDVVDQVRKEGKING